MDETEAVMVKYIKANFGPSQNNPTPGAKQEHMICRIDHVLCLE